MVDDASKCDKHTAQNKMHFFTKLFELVVCYKDIEAENMPYITELLKRPTSGPYKKYLNVVLV